MKLLIRTIYFMSAFVLGTGAILFYSNDQGLFDVKAIPVVIKSPGGAQVRSSSPQAAAQPGPAGLRARTEKAVRKFENKRIWQIDIKDLKASIAQDEWVKDVLISRSFPNQVRVELKAKETVAILVSAKGQLFPVTSDGSMLGPLLPESLSDAPLLRGENLLTNEGKRAQAIAFLMELPDRGPLSRRNISEVTWTEEDGFTVSLMQPKTDVKLGDDKLSIKVLRVTQVLNYLSANHQKSRVIDASFAKKVLVRLRKGP